MLYIGIMSGTSLDGIDGVLCDFNNNKVKIIENITIPFSQCLHKDLQELLKSFTIHLEKLGELEVRLAIDYAKVVTGLLDKSGINAKDILAIGCHGQTVFHKPDGDYPFSLQLVDGNKLAALTGIKVICDFRRMDMAFGGSGAPLTPAFHQGFLNSSSEKRVILNLGGIANITILDPIGNNIIGFDTGPANCLLDLWIQDQFQIPYDSNGAIAKSGNMINKLLDSMLKTPYFSQKTPKSTGKEIFHLNWVNQSIKNSNITIYSKEDIARTLLELTAVTIVNAIKKYGIHGIDAIYVCGGGAYNSYLLQRISELSSVKIAMTNELGIDVGSVEPVAFAWFAKQRIENKPANYESVTGATRRCILGALYEA